VIRSLAENSLPLTNFINTGFIIATADLAVMNLRQLIMVGVLGFALFATLSATAERDLARMKARESIGNPGASDSLFAARLNITTVKKTPLASAH
jgi:hypothetical protein